jgi:rare lipoprotein A
MIILLGFLTEKSPAQITESGYASYYAQHFEGKPTASGEPYTGTKLTAAHRTLPFGTLVEIINVKNGRKVVVRINDRGPFVEGRVLDVSECAAEKLNMLSDGVVQIRYRIVGLNEKSESCDRQ